MRLLRRLALAVTTVAAIATAGTACSTGSSSGDGSGADLRYVQDPKVINIVAGSEQKAVLDQIVVPWCNEHQYTCKYELKGSVDQARMLSTGNGNHDAYWFASSVFAQIGDKDGNRLQKVRPMFLTPTVFAGRKSEMQKLGFVGKSDVTMAEVLQAVESGQTKVWVTNPTQSNSGATAYSPKLGSTEGYLAYASALSSRAVSDGT